MVVQVFVFEILIRVSCCAVWIWREFSIGLGDGGPLDLVKSRDGRCFYIAGVRLVGAVVVWFG